MPKPTVMLRKLSRKPSSSAASSRSSRLSKGSAKNLLEEATQPTWQLGDAGEAKGERTQDPFENQSSTGIEPNPGGSTLPHDANGPGDSHYSDYAGQYGAGSGAYGGGYGASPQGASPQGASPQGYGNTVRGAPRIAQSNPCSPSAGELSLALAPRGEAHCYTEEDYVDPELQNLRPLDPGWSAVTAPDGGTYYWNEATNDTTWARPTTPREEGRFPRPASAPTSPGHLGAVPPARRGFDATFVPVPAAANSDAPPGTAEPMRPPSAPPSPRTPAPPSPRTAASPRMEPESPKAGSYISPGGTLMSGGATIKERLKSLHEADGTLLPGVASPSARKAPPPPPGASLGVAPVPAGIPPTAATRISPVERPPAAAKPSGLPVLSPAAAPAATAAALEAAAAVAANAAAADGRTPAGEGYGRYKSPVALRHRLPVDEPQSPMSPKSPVDAPQPREVDAPVAAVARPSPPRPPPPTQPMPAARMPEHDDMREAFGEEYYTDEELPSAPIPAAPTSTPQGTTPRTLR
eukprot:Transcript_12471.p1 GENE.Transcript_12471~~Transcript_12471.p1  ORF type:complete len:522 (+),score=14.27 Transcript_12471:71-1636(+)